MREVNYNNKIFNTKYSSKKLDELISSGFDLEYVYDVLMVDKKTGKQRKMLWGFQVSRESAMNEASAYMSRNYDIIDAWPVLVRCQEDALCLHLDWIIKMEDSMRSVEIFDYSTSPLYRRVYSRLESRLEELYENI